MTHSKLSPYDFIQYSFCPHIAVLSSPLAEQTCQKGNLSFIEMVQPFCRLGSEVHFRDPSGSLVNVKNLRVVMLDVNSRPPQTTLAHKFLNESVSSANIEQVTSLKNGNVTIEIPATVPWFESWRETFLQVQFPADHEFTKHYLACIIVLSTAEAVPLETARSLALQLQQLQAVAPGRLPKWFTAPASSAPSGPGGPLATPAPPTLLTSYLLLHDASEGDSAKADAALASIKEEFGATSCFLLTVNSRPPGQRDDAGHLPDPWSQFLNKRIEPQDGASSDYSSPRTPADVGMNMSSLCSSVGGDSNLEVAQEVGESGVISSAVPVMLHPLSPQGETPNMGPLADEPHSSVAHNHVEGSSSTPHINSNVWAGSAQGGTGAGVTHLPHGTSLTAADLDRIRTFVTEFCSRALLPHVEKQIQYLNDQISNKKGVSRSLLSATKRWFGPNKPGSPRSTSPNNVIYAGDAPELQLRRLADLGFMFRHYSLAYQAYHSAKRDFAADGAWLHYAGALEMAALASFMTGEYNRKTQDYHEEAIITYLNTCRMPQFATRSTLLSVVCLKSRNLYSDAARQLIRMTSEDSDLRSALLLEEAAYCFLQASRPGLLRKYAFHMVLAGHRFSKAAQRKHSLRCYQQAYQVYEGKGWSLAEDHIHFTIGRQAGSLGQRALATKALSRLLAPGSKQVPIQQAYHLREFLVMQQQLSAETATPESMPLLPLLPLPLVDSSLVQVLTGSPPHNPGLSNGCVEATAISFEEESKEFSSVWLSLEEQLLTEAQGNPPVVFKPLLTLFNRFTDNSRQPLMVLGESLWVCITVKNPLGVQLPLQDVRLLWTFEPDNTQDVIDSELVDKPECQRWVATQTLPHLVLQPSSCEKVVLNVVPQGVGVLKIKGLAYRLTNPALAESSNIPQTATNSIYVDGKQVFYMEPQKVPRSAKDRGAVEKPLEDLRLQPKVLPAAPLLQASFSALPAELICGEIQKVTMTLVNYGSQPLKNLLLGSDCPNYFVLDRPHPTGTVSKFRHNVVRLPLESGVLEAGAHIQLNLWVRPPDDCGSPKLRLLFYYESAVTGSPLKYRLLRHCWNLCVLDSLSLSVTPRRSAALNQQGGLNITALVTNTNKVQDLVIVKLSLLQASMSSPFWELSNLPVAPSEADMTLNPQECAYLMFRARAVSSKTPVLSDLNLITLPLPKVADLVPLSNSPHYDFLIRHSTSGQTQAQAPANTQSSEPSLATMAASAEAALRVDATFVVRWEAEVSDAAQAVRHAFGQHHVTLAHLSETVTCPSDPNPGPSRQVGRPRFHPQEGAATATLPASNVLRVFGPDRNVPSESDLSAEQVPTLEALQRLVTYYLQHPPRLVHNFNVHRLCFVPVQLLIRNCCESSLRVEVNLSGGQSSLASQNQLYVPQASSVVRWVSQLVSHMELSPSGTHTLSLRAAITAPGTYDLGALLTVACRFANEPNSKDTVQGTRVHSAVVVSHTDCQQTEDQVQQLSRGVGNMVVKDVMTT